MGSEGTLLAAALGPSVRVAAAAFAACIVFGLLGLLSLRGIWNAQPFQLLVGGVLCCFCFWIGAPSFSLSIIHTCAAAIMCAQGSNPAWPHMQGTVVLFNEV